MNRIITLTTDFGLSDNFVGVMKGVILNINPDATIIDITHDVAPQNVEHGAFLFANAYRYFPANSIHVVVVDPGVGSARRPLAAQVGETFFVAPDNGVLSPTISNLKSQIPNSEFGVIHLNKSDYWLAQVSNTFHGRDIFAPVAAHLSLGVPLEALGEPITDWVKLSQCVASWRTDDEIVGRVMHVDRFGNVITNIDEEMLVEIASRRARVVTMLRGKSITGIQSTYATVAPGELLALISSSGHLEIAAREANAAQLLGTQIGDEVVLRVVA